MTNPIVGAHRLLTATMAFVALIGWGAYAYSAKSSATRDQERLEAVARITTDREGLVAEQQRLVTEQERLVAAQQRLHGELALANVQLAVAREEIALLDPQQKSARKGDLGTRKPQKGSSGATARSDLAKLVASSQE
jgi:hypothetical protein